MGLSLHPFKELQTLNKIIIFAQIFNKLAMYNKKKLLKQAKEAIINNNLFFIEDVVAFLGVSKSTFYKYFPAELDEMDELKSDLSRNKALVKIELRKKWLASDNATTQLALYKLICDSDERRLLSVSYSEVSIEEQPNLTNIEDLL